MAVCRITRQEAVAELRARHQATWDATRAELEEFDDQQAKYAADWLLIMIVLENEP